MRPHVLYVTPIFGYPAFGGPRLRTYNTIQALARLADVSLYVTQQPDTSDRRQALQHLRSFCRDVVFPEEQPRPSFARRVVRRVTPAGLRTRPVTPDRAALIENIATWIRSSRPDLLWLGFGGISYELLQLKEQTHTPVVLETDCVWSRFILRELPFEADPRRRAEIERQGRDKQAEERSGAQVADITTAVSEVDAEYFRSISPDPERVKLLANVIDVASYRDIRVEVQLEQPAILFAGTLSHGTANIDAGLWLLDAIMPIVWRTRPNAHVYLVGRSPAPALLARRGQRVHVTGEVPAITPYMRASAMSVVPLRWESGTRFKILEAFACGTPVISTTLGAEGLAVQDQKHLLLADEPDTFAMAVLSLLEDPQRGERLAGPALELVQREYDLSSAERQLESILSALALMTKVPA